MKAAIILSLLSTLYGCAGTDYQTLGEDFTDSGVKCQTDCLEPAMDCPDLCDEALRFYDNFYLSAR